MCLDLDRMPEEIPEVFAMIQAADTVGVFQVESRAQMQTLPKSRPASLDDLVVEVAIIRPGPIQGNAVHPYLRRKQGLEPVDVPPSEPGAGPPRHAGRDPLPGAGDEDRHRRRGLHAGGVGRVPAGDGHLALRAARWRSSTSQFVDGCMRQPGMPERGRRGAVPPGRRVRVSFGFNKCHAAAFARTAYESAFLKLFYPAQFVVGLINAQPMGFYPVEVLVNDAKRHGVAVLPVDINRLAYKTATEWVGPAGLALAAAGDDGSHDGDPGRAAARRSGIAAPARPVRVGLRVPCRARRASGGRRTARTGWGVRLGLHLVKGIGEEHEALLDAELARGPYRVARGRRGADGALRGGRSSG